MPYRPLWKSLVSEARGGKGLVLAIDAALREIWDYISGGLITVYTGSSTFAGSTGVVVTIGSTLDGILYYVSITPTANSEDVGAVWVDTKTATTFTVRCTGSGTPTFDWVLNPSDGRLGTGTFNGIAGTTLAIGEVLDGVNYAVLITPTGNAEDVGAIYVSNKTTTAFTVYCTGAGTPTFDWVLIDNN